MLLLSTMITLCAEEPRDHPMIFKVVEDAFGKRKEADLVELVRERGNSRIAIVAHDETSLVGYVLASPKKMPLANALNCLALGPVAVVPDRQGEEIGSKRMHQAIQTASEQGVDAIFLLGRPSYYSRFGFAPTHISNEYGATDAFMASELRDGCLDGLEALAKYVSEFTEVGV